MIFALLVCTLMLVLVVYFVALMTSEIALWLANRLSERESALSTSMSTQH